MPSILGPDALGPYKGYDDTVDASVSNIFSTACYRLGHSMLSGVVGIGRIGRSLLLRDLFFRPEEVKRIGVDTLLDGLAYHRMEEIDHHIIDDVRSFLFHAPDPVGSQLLDLVALNIQRGRDHGLPSYNGCREAYGLPRKKTFADMTSDVTLQQALASVYSDVDDVDPWVGGLCEDHVAGASVGEFIRTVLVEQFQRTRHGDRFWYANDHGIDETTKQKLEATTLADIVQNQRCPA
ncbi:peroxidase family protein [Candidatus Accumulibacter sp. ACC003]|uniref:peroxidase family protein n=1 Tax=Candidatus Accumulibacter sp. ACC003 TaxID=2823334 RepID=UPI00344E2AA0